MNDKVPILAQIEARLEEYDSMAPSALEVELGRLMRKTADELEQCTELTAAQAEFAVVDDAATMGEIDILRRFGRRFWRRFQRTLYSLACDPSDPDHERLREAIEKGGSQLGLVLAGIFIANFGWLPAIATCVAALVVKRLTADVHASACELWHAELGLNVDE